MSNRDELLVEVLRLAGEDRAADLAARVLARADQTKEPQNVAEANASASSVATGARSSMDAVRGGTPG